MPRFKDNTKTRRTSKARSSKKHPTLHFPLTDALRDLRVAKCRVALLAAARLVMETGFSRERAIDWFDDLLVAAAVEEFPDNIHMAALLLDVPEGFIKKRWNGLKS